MDERIPPSEVLDRLGEEEVVVVDCRGEEERRRVPVQIPGALSMSLEEIRASPWTLPDDELIVLYDGTKECHRARAALRVLSLAGRKAVWLDGGLHAWVAHGYPTERIRRAAAVDDEPAVAQGTHG